MAHVFFDPFGLEEGDSSLEAVGLSLEKAGGIDSAMWKHAR